MIRRPHVLAALALILVVGCSGGESGEPSATQDETASSPGSVSPPAAPTTEENDPPASVPPPAVTLPEGDEPVSLGPLGGTELELATADGVVELGRASIPDLIPPSFPLPADLTVQLATTNGMQAGLSGSTQRGFDDLVEFYRDGLTDSGYETDEVRSIDGMIAVFRFDGPDGIGEVAISPTPGGSSYDILVTFDA